MKQIIAVVKPFLAEKLVEALRRAPLEALTVREVKGYGRQKDQLDRYEQSEYALAFLPKVEIEAWVEDARAAEVVERIEQIAHTGRMGDGKVFILPVARFENG
jgi:nitrogen regulatory protein PII